jgi:ABC-2 type transport system ATP-binding protein
VLGLGKKEIEERMPHIIRFSELEDFIDAPVRTYSSGMYARLAFSVAINVNCDILLVDEILAVGDMNFQTKCNNHIRKLKDAGTTIVIVSHSMAVLDQLCDYALFFNKGELLHQGEPRTIQFKYMEFMAKQQEEKNEATRDTSDTQDTSDTRDTSPEETALPLDYTPGLTRWGNRHMVLRNLKMLDKKGVDRRTFYRGEKIRMAYEYVCRKDPKGIDPVFGFGIYSKGGWYVYGTNTLINKLPPVSLQTEGTVAWDFTELNLLPGDYVVQIAVIDRDGRTYDFQNEITEFRVLSETVGEMGTSWMGYEIKIDGKLLGGNITEGIDNKNDAKI